MNWRPLTRVGITVAIVLLLDLLFAKAQIAKTSVPVERDNTAPLVVDGDAASLKLSNAVMTMEELPAARNGQEASK